MGFLIVIMDFILKHGVKRGDIPPGKHGAVEIELYENRGLPFGRLAEHERLVLALPAFFLGLSCAAYPACKKKGRLAAAAAGLLISGGAGNLADRVKNGYVTDYIKLSRGRIKNVIFNLSDLCILLGAAALAADMCMGEQESANGKR